eukprot:scaffold7832_cov106-Isochrysis_galbana.AAC.5
MRGLPCEADNLACAEAEVGATHRMPCRDLRCGCGPSKGDVGWRTGPSAARSASIGQATFRRAGWTESFGNAHFYFRVSLQF